MLNFIVSNNYSYLIIICLHTAIWFQVILIICSESFQAILLFQIANNNNPKQLYLKVINIYTNNLQTIIWFKVFLGEVPIV